MIVGVSFIGFKLIHFFVDRRSADLQDAKPLEVLAWLLFFPAIVAGPMQRFQDWRDHAPKSTRRTSRTSARACDASRWEWC